MKAHFRKTEYYTSYNANTPVELDSEKFPDFKGETEEEFLYSRLTSGLLMASKIL